MMLWRGRTLLLGAVALLTASLVDCSDKNTTQAPSGTTATATNPKADMARQGSAGMGILGLATLLFPVLPLLIAPLALGSYLNGGSSSQSDNGPLSNLINSISGGSNEPQPSESSLSTIAQALGLRPPAQQQQSSPSLFSGLLGGSGASGGSGSFLSSLLGSDSGSDSSSIFGNSASGSRPIGSYLAPPAGRPGQNQPSAADLLGVAAAALDNAGLLSSLAGLSQGGNSASMAQQLINAVINSANNNGGMGDSGKQPLTANSGPLSDILNGLGSNASPNAVSPPLGTQKLGPNLGSSLSSNIIQGLQVNPAMMQQGMANMAHSPKPQASLASLLGLGSQSQSSG
ncbi:hypothetical protein HDE_08374 [Halotydeus destructor]|nr:hypothetical protein HDE_08374 [Halotydeus destructor]